MISSFTIGNFKAFGPAQTIPLKPITLIFGPNSAGKSSIIHSLLLARHALDNKGNLDVLRPDLGGDSVDLGGFRQYVFRRNLSNTVEWRANLPASDLSPRLRQLLPAKEVAVSLQWKQPLNDFGEPVEGAAPTMVALEFSADGEWVFRLSRRPDHTMQVDRASPKILGVIAEVILAAHSIGVADPATHAAELAGPLASIATEARFAGDDFLPRRPIGRDLIIANPPYGHVVPVSRGTREEDLLSTAQLVGPRLVGELVAGLGEAFAGELRRATYLGPLRSYPARHLAFAEDHDRNWKAGGGYAWDIVRTSPEVRAAVNRWLSADALKTKYQLEIRTLTSIEALEGPLRDTLEEVKIDVVEEGHPPGGEHYDGDPPVWGIPDLEAEASRFVQELRRRAHETFQELVLVDLVQKTPVSHRDVGIGISQVLPVLVHAYADRDQLVAIEQPEIHLHPMLQTHLADVFIKSALERNNTFILETHSEHLLLRIMRRMRETAEGTLPPGASRLTPNDVALLFVSPDPQGSLVQDIGLNERGELVKGWPGGFFEEGLEEMFS